MPSSAGHKATPTLEEKAPPTHSRLSTRQKITLLGFTLTTAGYAAFTDAISFIFMVRPLRSEYQLEEAISEPAWFSVSIGLASTYGLYTLICEGKGSHDALREYLLSRNSETAMEVAYEPLPQSETEAPQRQTRRSVFAESGIRLAAVSIALVGSLSDSAETTMGLVDEGATLPKTILISSLSFLLALFYYGPIALTAFEELFLGITPRKETQPYRLLAKIIGYPIALFSAIQDTLECGTSLFENFSITHRAHQWGLIGLSSLGGISSICLDGKRGVDVLNHFLIHLEDHYAWLPHSLWERTAPTRDQLSQLVSEAFVLGLSAYAASYISFADKELTIALSTSILSNLGIETVWVPELLGWGTVLKDSVIQTNTLNMLIRTALKAAWRLGERLVQDCAQAEPILDALPEMEEPEREEIELTPLAAPREKVRFDNAEEAEKSNDEDAILLSHKQRSGVEEEKQAQKAGIFSFFNRKPRNLKRDPLEPEGTHCLVM